MGLKSLVGLIKQKIKGSLKVAIEDGMVVEPGVTVMGGVSFGSEPYLITLRKNCRISGQVIFVNHDGGTWAFRSHWPEYANVVKYGRIEVGEESFVGTRSVILPGVKIGRNCVIGAGSVVTKDIPDGSVACGVPARVVCTTEEYAQKCLKSMPEDFDFEAYKADKKAYLKKVIK